MNFVKLYIGDYVRDTGTLTLAQHGAYLLMLCEHYANEKALPKGKDLYRLLRADSKAERDAIDFIAVKFWTETADGLTNSRALREIERASHQRAVNQQIGKRGGRPKRTERQTDSVIGDRTQGGTNVRGKYANPGTFEGFDAAQHNSRGVSLQSTQVVDSQGNHITDSVTDSVSEPEPNRNPNQTPDYSVPKGTGALAPDELFGDGLSYLIDSGVAERGARSFLGRLRKTAGDLVAVELLATAQSMQVSEPLAWLRASALRRAADGRSSTGVSL